MISLATLVTINETYGEIDPYLAMSSWACGSVDGFFTYTIVNVIFGIIFGIIFMALSEKVVSEEKAKKRLK